MTHKNMTKFVILRAAMIGSLALLVSACDGGSSDPAAPDGAAAGDTDTASAVSADAASDAAASDSTLAATQVTVHRDANGVATGEITVGSPDAVEMIEYVSLTCPHCAAHHINVWPEIKKTYIDTGRLKLTFRIFSRGPLDEIVSMVPMCAADDRVYPIIDLMLSRQDRWLHGENGREVVNNLAAIVRRTGMSRATFDSCIRNQAILANVRTLRDIGLNEDQVRGTPTFILDGESFNSAEFATFVEKIEDAL